MKNICSLLLLSILLSSCAGGNYYRHREYVHACADEIEDGKEVSETCYPFDEQNTYMSIHKLWPSQKRLTKPMPDIDDY